MDINKVIFAAIEYDKGDPRRIQHFIKVHEFAKIIAAAENIDPYSAEIIETAAILHDIGIHECERKYGSCAGKYQEKEGAPVAREILLSLGAEEPLIERVCFLVAHHHTYENVNSDDWQILIEADFLVNIFEDGMQSDAVKQIVSKVFRTAAGKRLAETLYL
ncbi:MAG: HD domain-containing protein [Ruminococcus sp.]|nr:HD domain-containing protein [Ruminococcus sp.]MCM1382620.1 HD domain-containing protein [Muribaculaceae bacterium]MCM1480690.1 HD domain-containing protein [Muribaculaceae bacterium]